MSEAAHTQPTTDVLSRLDSESAGLSASEARTRRDRYGENEITRGSERTPLDIAVAQFDSALIWVLVAAAILSVWAGNAVDAVLIAVIVVGNGLFGFVQDYRAEGTLESLRELTAPTATVRRDGQSVEVDATELVPGDVIELESGDVVPADARLIDCQSLEVDEAALTGESTPVSKGTDPVDADAPLAERESMVYKGTNVTRGSGVAVLTATGMDTEVGAIARQLAGTEETDTPLQTELDTLGRTLGIGVIVLAALVVPLLVFRGTELVQAALTAISLAVAAVPEGLPAVVTLTLALGVRKMADENALVRRLPAVEALGSVDVICTDKTGTLTEGRMSVSRIWVNDAVVDSDEMYGDALPDRVATVLRAGTLCSDATLEAGDPTEQAIVMAAAESGIDVERLREANPRTDEIPFSSERKWMGTVHDDTVYVKGAPEVILSKCARVLTDTGPADLTPDRAEQIREQVGTFADDALRVLAVAYTEDVDVVERDDTTGDADDVSDDLTFAGLVGMIDPAREEVADAIAATERAGVGVKMVTGDNVRTAAAIAGELGLGQRVMEGGDVENCSEDTLATVSSLWTCSHARPRSTRSGFCRRCRQTVTLWQ